MGHFKIKEMHLKQKAFFRTMAHVWPEAKK